ncbi:MAG TPA: VOC family protein [Methanomicrobia archaeon]|nr:VOC family protein [Methanomicrobia archaeon]
MPTIVHFDIPADDPERAKKFYEELFGWKIEQTPGFPYYLIETTDLEGNPGVGGGMGPRQKPNEQITQFFGVESIAASVKKVEALGGSVVAPRMPVPGWGYLAVCRDTEQNLFGLWEEDQNAR